MRSWLRDGGALVAATATATGRGAAHVAAPEVLSEPRRSRMAAAGKTASRPVGSALALCSCVWVAPGEMRGLVVRSIRIISERAYRVFESLQADSRGQMNVSRCLLLRLAPLRRREKGRDS